jgi:hypothetical protein
MPSRIPLSLLPREIARLTGRPAPDYRRIYNAVLNDRLPGVERGENGRWSADPAALPAIAAALGLSPAQAIAA